MAKNLYAGIALGTCVAAVVILLIRYEIGDSEKPQVVAEISKQDVADIAKRDFEAEFFANIKKLSQNETQKQKYAEIVEKFTQIVGEEAKKNPQAMSSHIEEMIRLVPKAGPGVSIQFEEYASQIVREEMNKLRQDSNVIRLNELEKEFLQNRKLIKEVQEKEKMLATKVPVLLMASNSIWTDATVFKITNSLTQEIKSYTLSTPYQSGSKLLKIFLEPAEYSVEFSFKVCS